jgi:hypothetical protein
MLIYCWGDQIQESEVAGHVARMGQMKNAYKILVETPGGRRRLGKPRRKWKDNIKMDLMETVCSG